MNHKEKCESEMKDEYLIGFHCRKATRTAQSLGLALLLTLLLLLAACGGSSTIDSSPTSAPASSPTTQAPVSNLTLSQAQQQAGYHLLSIPSSLTGYTLTKVLALDFSGHRAYSLYYSIGKNNITITEGYSLGSQSGGSKVSLRGTIGTLYTLNGQTTLSWTENRVSMIIHGPLSSAQAITLAKSLV